MAGAAAPAAAAATAAAAPDAGQRGVPALPAANAVKLSPAAKRVADENKVDPQSVQGSGRDGRVSKSDVVNHLQAKEPAASGAAERGRAGGRAEQRVPMTRLRARIAERMVQAQATQALLTSFNEVDLHSVNALRARLQGCLREALRREARVHVVLRQGLRRGAAQVPRGERLGRGQRHRLPRVLRLGVAVSTDRGSDRAGAARRR